MTVARSQTPSWGVFRDMTARGIEPQDEPGRPDAAVMPAQPPQVTPALPVFDTLAPLDPADDDFYARPSEARSEEEFDELGEGAFRQIGRNLANVVGHLSAAACLALAVLWMVPSGNSTTMIAQGSPDTAPVAKVEDAVTVAAKIPASDTISATEDRKFVEIDVELPIPSVIAKADPNSTALQSTLHADAGYPSPTPLPRSVAMASMEFFEDGRLAEGSDDEALSASRKAKPWVSVMIPKTRPSF